MKASMFLLAAAAFAGMGARASNPLGTVITLLTDLSAKVTKDGEAEQKAFREYAHWCKETAANTQFEIKTATSEKGKLEAAIVEASSDIDVATSKIEELAGSIAESSDELKQATEVRDKELADFVAGEHELDETIGTLDRAINILSREAAKNPALAQVDRTAMTKVLQSLSAIADAASFSSADRNKIVALVQSHDDDSDAGAPAAAVYKSHGTDIIELLEDLKDKSEGQLSDLRKTETTSAHNFAMLKQSLEDQAAVDKKHMDDEKKGKAAAEGAKATDEGDLERTTQELKAAEETLASTHHNCMQASADFEENVNARAEELTVIAQAKKILEETSGGAVDQTYSFLQMRTESAPMKVANMVKKLAANSHSAALAQLASRVIAIARYGNKADVFGKVKELINSMIAKLQKEGEEAATEKAYCDEQMSKTEAKKSELEDDAAKLKTKIDQASAKSAELQSQVQTLGEEIAEIQKSQAEMDKSRQDEHAAYTEAKEDLVLGIAGVQKAHKVLSDYYESEGAALVQQPAAPSEFKKAGGAGASIIDILDVVLSDFEKNLAGEEATERSAAELYDKTTQENKVSLATKEQDVKYKTQEFKALDVSIAELSADAESVATELDAVNDYYAKIRERCIAKPETYADRKARRSAEIAGLKQALEVLETETALIQHHHRFLGHRSLTA